MRRFLFRLALSLGRTVAELERQLSAAELAEWLAYSIVEPFGQGRTDDGARGVMALLYNANRPAKSKALDASDFMPAWRPQEHIDRDARIARLKAWLDAKTTGDD